MEISGCTKLGKISFAKKTDYPIHVMQYGPQCECKCNHLGNIVHACKLSLLKGNKKDQDTFPFNHVQNKAIT